MIPFHHTRTVEDPYVSQKLRSRPEVQSPEIDKIGSRQNTTYSSYALIFPKIRDSNQKNNLPNRSLFIVAFSFIREIFFDIIITKIKNHSYTFLIDELISHHNVVI